MADATDELVQERRGAVSIARLNRPEARNALTPGLLAAIGAAIVDAETDPDVRVLVITGTGDRAFCAGMDLRAFSRGDAMASADDEATAAYHRLTRGEVSVPLVGAANATAVAGGFELLLGCDLIVASTQAQFGLPEVKRGLFPAGGGTAIATRVPLSIALEMTMTGDSISAERAYELGLVNAVVAPDEVLSMALDFADRIAANAPLGLAAVKDLVRLSITDPSSAMTRLAEWQRRVFTSEDAKEGAAAFIEKRPPVWRAV